MKVFKSAIVSLLFWSAFSAAAQTPQHLKSINIRAIGPGAMSGRITAITTDPTDTRIVYAGAASGGVWRSKSGGTNWTPIFDKAPTQSVGAIAINPHNPDEIWVGTGEGNPRNSQNFGVGIFRSLDGGETWTCMGLEKTRAIHRILLHRENPSVIWVAALGSATGPNEERGVFKSTDGGATWKKVLYTNDLSGCADLVADPRNPNKLFAAMWEYRRQPWFFKSGGAGSGLYVSYDGGENWVKRTDKDGLPEGEIGRIGLAIARSNPDVVYALVEAKENALYKSTDGGKKWRKMADKNQGDRPFYYHELYVDPLHENTLYSVHSQITKSIDGGRTFDSWVNYWRIHPDHHAFWINPNDPQHIINGNDGGINITYDGGNTWRYAENIPIGQFYHVNVDNELPYNVYGGLQDNGTWVGPSAVWKAGGMRNSEWQEVYFGDGFDAMPQKDNPRYCFAMSQGGELGHVDRLTGETRYIKPLHPDGLELRWNWNAALAQDPFNNQGLYFCSQYVHYSPDLGHSWRLLSPDLTTNDTSKQHQDISGGLTYDATNAENHCTILAVAPSPLEKDVIWVGTDDGNLQLTRDGGKTWENLSSRLPDCPKNAWIPQIEVSPVNPGEAFVVVNNYRMNDWAPYLYHTADYGKKWRRLAGPKQVNGFCLSIVQDAKAPNLLFLGTDQGLYFSLNSGEQWQHWPQEGFPCVPVQDMKIHPRDGDLVIATFGRAIWIMDQIEPLRELARQPAPDSLLNRPFKVFAPQPAILAAYASYDGPRFAGDTEYLGQNKGTGGLIPIWVKPMKKEDKPAKKEGATEEAAQPAMRGGRGGRGRFGRGGSGEKATITVLSMQGDTMRRWKTELDTAFTAIYWGLDTRGVAFPSKEEPDKDQLEPGGGPQVAPGQYKVVVEFRNGLDSTILTVLDDPRLNISASARQGEAEATRKFYATVEQAKKAYDRLLEAEKAIKNVENAFVYVPDSTKKEVLQLGSAIRDSIANLKELFFTHKEVKGIQRNPNTLNSHLSSALNYIRNSEGPPNGNAQIAIRTAETETARILEQINALFDTKWIEFKQKAGTVEAPLFKE